MGVVEVNWTVNEEFKPRSELRPKAAAGGAEKGGQPWHEHPEWLRMREKILVALAPFLDARRAVERALTPERRPEEHDW